MLVCERGQLYDTSTCVSLMASKQRQLTNRSTGATIGVAIDGLKTKSTDKPQYRYDN